MEAWVIIALIVVVVVFLLWLVIRSNRGHRTSSYSGRSSCFCFLDVFDCD